MTSQQVVQINCHLTIKANTIRLIKKGLGLMIS
jgi:hypothetical protein